MRLRELFVVSLVVVFFTSCAAPAISPKSEPPKPVDLLAQALSQYNAGNYEEAILTYLAVIEIEPMNPSGYTGAAEAYVRLGDTDSAVAVLRRGMEQLPDEITIITMLGGLIGMENKLAPTPEPPPTASPAGESLNYMPAHIAALFQQLSNAMQVEDYERAHSICMNPQLIEFSKEAELNPKCYDVIIRSPLKDKSYSPLGEMISAQYINLEENGNGKVVEIWPDFGITSLNHRQGYIIHRYGIANMKPNGNWVTIIYYLVEDAYNNIGVQTTTGKLADGLYDGEWVTTSNAAKNGFWFRSDVYSNGKYLYWVDPDVDDGAQHSVEDNGDIWQIDLDTYLLELPNWGIQ